MKASTSVLLLAAGVAGCSASPEAPTASSARLIEVVAPLRAPAEPPGPVDPQRTYLAPNTEDVDGTPGFVHYEREHMPLRVNVDSPRESARYASRDETNDAVLDGLRMWAQAIQRTLPWFSIALVSGDESAPIQIRWRRRIPGSGRAGQGGIGWSREGGELVPR